MSKYFKNYKSEGDGENRTSERSRVHPRSYSCKPDIGPSGDHKSSETRPVDIEPKRNFRMNMWLNNIGSGSSESSHSNAELYRINEDHLEKINVIRRKLNMIELQDTQETETAVLEFCDSFDSKVDNMNQKQFETNRLEYCTIHERNDLKIAPQNRLSSPSIDESSNVQIFRSDAMCRYNPPLKRICRHCGAQSTVAILAPINTNKTNCSVTDVIEIPTLNLDVEQTSQRNKNKSIQCTSEDTELTESSSHSTDHSKLKCHHRGDMGDNIDLVELDSYIEPDIVLSQPTTKTKTPNKNCIKFLPIDDGELTSSDKSKREEFFDEIVSNCSFSIEKPSTPLVPSHDSFFKSRRKQRKKRFKKRLRNTVEEVELDESSIDVQRTFLDTSETSERIEEIKVNDTPVIDMRISPSKFDTSLMTSLTIPSKTVKPLRLPLVTKLSQLIHGLDCRNSNGVDVQKFAFEDVCSEESTMLTNKLKRVGMDSNTYKQAAEDLISMSGKSTDDMNKNEAEHIHYNLMHRKTTNRFNTKKKQSVNYNFYSLDLPPGGTCDVVHLGPEVEEDSDSDCLETIRNCCHIGRIFRRKRPTFLSK